MVTQTGLPKEDKPWNATGLKFLFSVLTDPNLLNAAYRAIAAVAGIALGDVRFFNMDIKQTRCRLITLRLQSYREYSLFK